MTRSGNFVNDSKRNAEKHYNRGEDIYDWMLDSEHRQYSCALFKDPNESLEQAQTNKLLHIGKKLDLKKGERILEIGCGWGGMAFELARQSQCEVKGISLSENQIRYCKNKAKELNLDNQVHFELCDYRKIDDKFDRVVSVGAFEHFGKKFYKTFFKKVNNLLNVDGLALIHTIGSVDGPRDPQPWITKYIFPGGYTPSTVSYTHLTLPTNREV